jgi:HAD superfamily hydrolase (TIGR01509 family)
MNIYTDMNQKIPVVALVGLPNSGKSTLLNRFTGTHKAIVAREAHTTRDVNWGQDFFEGLHIKFVDTGGLVPDPEDKIQKEVQIKSWTAIAEADMLVWVIDRKQNPDTISEQILQRVWKTGKPFIIGINKVDDPNLDRSVADYAFIGGNDFVNFSCNTGYGLNELMDAIIKQLLELGFEKSFEVEFDGRTKKRRRREKLRDVHKTEEGNYYLIRDEQNMFELVDANEGKTQERTGMLDIVVDLYGVLLDDQKKINLDVERFLLEQRALNKRLFYLSNCKSETIDKLKEERIWQYFDGGLTSEEAGAYKPDIEIFRQLMEGYELNPETTLFIDDTFENTQAAETLGWSSITYFAGQTDLDKELATAEKRPHDTPKIIFVGKPNVGKSSLFNAMIGENVQIVTEIAGTTMSVNDTVITRTTELKLDVETADGEEKQELVTKELKYVLLDSVGIRKPGKRTFGAENFGTYRSIQTAHESDVICLVVDGSEPLAHQDQVVAGIAKEARKGLVVIVNKADLVEPSERKKFIRQFETRFQFLKVREFVWVSALKAGEGNAKEIDRLEDIWEKVDLALQERETDISKERLRKLFNFLVKKKQPPKLRTKKKAIMYDLFYTKSKPPTFELIVKDRKTIHWSYVRFLENLIRRNFDFDNTEIVVKVKEMEVG